MIAGYYYKNIEQAQIKEKKKEDDFFAIGHEGCVHKIPSADSLKVLRKREKGKRIHLITPLVSQKNIENLKRKVTEIIDNNLVDSISFNDYGVLYYFCNKYKNSTTEFYMGRLLMKSFSDCPWSENIIEDESDITKQYMRGLTINDSRKISFFKNMGVDGIEISVKKNDKMIKEIKDYGLKIIGHANSIIASASRICTQGAYYKREYPECTEYCNKYMVAELNEIWSFNKEGYTLPSDEVKEMVPRYYINGNISYYKILDEKDVDEINYDYLLRTEGMQ